MKKETIGGVIYNARKRKNLKQEEVAKHLHVSRQSISGWENDKFLPDISIIEELCKYLDIDSKTMLQLMKYNNDETTETQKKHSKVLKIIILLLIIIFISFAFIFTLSSINKFTVYTISLDTEDFSTSNGIFIASKIENYFQLGNITPHLEGINIYDCQIKIYTIIDNTEKIIIETTYDDNIVLTENYGYNEYFNDINKEIENMYIDIIYNNGTDIVISTYKLDFEPIIKSDKIFYLKNKNPEKENKNNKEIYINTKKLETNNYVLEEDIYTKKDENTEYSYIPYTHTLTITSDHNNELKYIEYNLNYKIIEASIFNKINGEYTTKFSYNLNNNKLECLIGTCHDNYEEMITQVKKELTKMMN